MANQILSQPRLAANATAQDFIFFDRQIRNYLLVVGATDAQKLPIFLNCLPEDALAIHDGLPAPRTTLEETIERFKEYFSASSSLLLRRREFYSCRQEPSESATAFANRLRRLASTCAFTNTAELLRDMFVFKVCSSALADKLLQEEADKLTFEVAIAKAQAFERGTSDRGAHSIAACAVRPNQGKSVTRQLQGQTTSSGRSCYRCGQHTHMANDRNCPARQQSCRNCGKEGHFQRVCRAAATQPKAASKPGEKQKFSMLSATEATPVSAADGDSFLISAINNDLDSTFKIAFLFDDKQLIGTADSGAAANVISLQDVQSTHKIEPTNTVLKAYGGFKLPVVGQIRAKIRYNNCDTNATFIVIDEKKCKPLISYSLCKELGVFHIKKGSDYTPISWDKMKLTDEIFQGLGDIKKFQYDLKVRDGAKPYFAPPRRVPTSVLDEVKTELDNLVKTGVIEEVENSGNIQWCAPLVVVRKKTGGIRLAIDYRGLNRHLQRPYFQMPSADDMTMNMSGAKFFSVLDARSGYHQIKMSQNSKQYLIFATPFGFFTFSRMPFGLSTACEIYQKLMTIVLQGLRNVQVYVDDIIVTGRTEEEHDESLSVVIERLKSFGVKLNAEKCQFKQKQISFLGLCVSSEGVAPDPIKCLSLDKAETPTNKKELRAFLGLASYIAQRFVPGFSQITAPLWDLLQGEYTWTKDSEIAFARLKSEVKKIKPLAFYDPAAPIKIFTDASKEGCAAVLVQGDRPILFASRKTTEVEKRYSQNERETTAVLFALIRFKPFIFGKRVTICTDNQPLTKFADKPMEHLSSRLQRILLRIQDFDYEMVHVKASENQLADFLSRFPDEEAHEEVEEETIALILREYPVGVEMFNNAIKNDLDYLLLKRLIVSDWSEPFKQNGYAKKFHTHRKDLAINENGIVTFCDRWVVPSGLTKNIIGNFHEGHVGITNLNLLIKDKYFWPGMEASINEFVRNCKECVQFAGLPRDMAKQSLTEGISKPNETWGIDIVGPSDRLAGKCFLSVIDYASRFPFLFELTRSTTKEVIQKLKELISMTGVVSRIVSDNGTVFSSYEFSQFAKKLGIQHSFTSVYRPSSNAVVERFHGSLKSKLNRMLADPAVNIDDAVSQALFDIRSSPNSSTGITPFEAFYGRKIRCRSDNVQSPAVLKKSLEKEKGGCIDRGIKVGIKVNYRRGRTEKYFAREGKVKRIISDRCVEIEDLRSGRCFKINQQFLRIAPQHEVKEPMLSVPELVDIDREDEHPHSEGEETEPSHPSPTTGVLAKGKYNLRPNPGPSNMYR